MWQVDDVIIAASTSGHPQILGLGTMHTLSRHNLGTMHLNEKVKRSRLVAAKVFFSVFFFLWPSFFTFI